MSWITDLADKAENILNKIDQNAATALQETKSLDVVKDSLASSAHSLTTTLSLSPSKRNISNKVSSAGATPKSEGVTSTASVDANLDVDELTAFKHALSEITAERDDLRQRQSNDSEDDAQANFLQQRIEELVAQAKIVTAERDEAFRQLSEAQNRCMQSESSLTAAEANFAKLRLEHASATQKLQMQTNQAEQLRNELQEYRTKAQRGLQLKDQLIADLRSQTAAGRETSAEQTAELLDQQQLSQQLQEALEMQESLRQQVSEHQTHEQALVAELAAHRAKTDIANAEIRTLRERNIMLESEQRLHTQELSSLRQQLSNGMAAAATRLQEKDKQLQQLKRDQSANLDLINNSKAKERYEQRLRALTESLVERQNALEIATAERNELKLQFERLQLDLQELVPESRDPEYQRRTMRNPLISNSTDDAKAQFPRLMYPNPFDNRVARRVKRAYNKLDSAGIRLGVFLRRYPLLRIGLLIYVFILPIWVIFVLMSTMPN